jgi:hypothetical protein
LPLGAANRNKPELVSFDRMVLVDRSGDTRIPIFNSSSLAMRSSPHEGFSFAIRRSSARSQRGGGRPGRDFRHQNNFHPARCQRINVCGRTTIRASRQLKHHALGQLFAEHTGNGERTARRYAIGNSRQVVVQRAYSFPCGSSMRPSAIAVLLPL